MKRRTAFFRINNILIVTKTQAQRHLENHSLFTYQVELLKFIDPLHKQKHLFMKLNAYILRFIFWTPIIPNFPGRALVQPINGYPLVVRPIPRVELDRNEPIEKFIFV